MVTKKGFNYMVDDVPANKARIILTKGRKSRVAWMGIPWAGTLAVFSIGAVYNNPLETWTVSLSTKAGTEETIPLDDFLQLDG